MNDKFFLKSKTIIGAVLLLFKVFEINLPFTEAEGEALFDNILASVGIILVIWGRITAKKPLGFNPSH